MRVQPLATLPNNLKINHFFLFLHSITLGVLGQASCSHSKASLFIFGKYSLFNPVSHGWQQFAPVLATVHFYRISFFSLICIVRMICIVRTAMTLSFYFVNIFFWEHQRPLIFNTDHLLTAMLYNVKYVVKDLRLIEWLCMCVFLLPIITRAKYILYIFYIYFLENTR